MRILKVCCLLLIPCLGITQNDNRITIGKADSVWSSTLKERRKILIYTPPSYNDVNFLPAKYPVLYLLDGEAHFHSVTALIQYLGTGINGNYVIPEMIVVAISNTDRTRDLTPTHLDKDDEGKPQPFLRNSGGNTNFFSFIKNELIPHIDSAFRTSPYRLFVGHSFGGITVINALYAIPETFQAYVSIDPSLWYDNQLLLKKATDFFSKSNLKGKFLFVSQANTLNAGDSNRNMHFESIIQFNSVMQAYNSSGIQYQYKYYPDDDHGSVPFIAEYDALRFIFEGYKPNMARIAKDPALVKEHYKKLSEKLGMQFLPPERTINDLGYRSFRDLDKAIAFFQLNIDLYPKSPNVYDSMGEAWMEKGDFKKAIDYYEKSLALNPANENEWQKKMKKMK